MHNRTQQRRTRKRRLRHAALAAFAALAATWVGLPFPRAALQHYPAATLVTDRKGEPLRLRLGPGDLDCRPVYRYEPGDWIAMAVVAAEDERFWHHPGLDPLAILRALGQNLAAGRTISGASTISTQVIRLVQPRPRTLVTKVVEAFRALQLEKLLAKPEILTQYLNRAPFGGNIVGVEAASRRYFGKGPHELSLAEAALLAGLPQSPARLRPDRHPAAAWQREVYVLGRMARHGMISPRDEQAARRQPLAVRPAPYPFAAPHFCELALQDAANAGADGSILRTTLDPGLQALAESALRQQAARLAAGGIRGGAIVILEVKTGAVRALVGSPDFGNAAGHGAVNGATAPRSAGSTLKPFLYAQAFDQGILTPGSVLADVPKVYRDYRPSNFDDRFLGLVPAREALILSLNMPALALEEQIGPAELQHRLLAAGLRTLNRPPDFYGLGLALGSGEVTLLDLANAYACLARGGAYCPWRLREETASPAPARVFSPEAAWLVADALSGQERAGAATGHGADVRLPRVAWKTGTSSGFRDAWTLAFNPDYVIGVWFGDPDGAGAPQLVGKEAAAPVAWELFRALYPRGEAPWFARPARLQSRLVCAATGKLPNADCPATVEDWCIRGVTLQANCDQHPGVAAFPREHPSPRPSPPRAEGEDTRMCTSGDSSTDFTPPLPPPSPLGGEGRGEGYKVVASRALGALHIRTPADGAIFRLSDGLDAARQQLALEATGPAAADSLYWFVNGTFIGLGRPDQPRFWPLARGRHTFICADTRGHNETINIVVE